MRVDPRPTGTGAPRWLAVSPEFVAEVESGAQSHASIVRTALEYLHAAPGAPGTSSGWEARTLPGRRRRVARLLVHGPVVLTPLVIVLVTALGATLSYPR